MKKFKLPFLALAVLGLSACVGPLVIHETGRSVGKGNHEIMGGYGSGGYVIKWNAGITDDWDIGLHWESLSIGLRTKYSFINNQEKGWSVAGAAGFGESIGGNHYYGDAIASYLVGAWEPYGTLRIVHVTTDAIDFADEDTGEVDFHVGVDDFNYGQVMLGTRYWFNKTWMMSIELSTLFSMTEQVKFGNSALVGLAAGARF